ncbi:MAG: hypothetical protein JRD84_00005, partial [Deltaproteobacteria bacterium]|nr:hypothetical protein [Deltaproteobacteria bacterium]
MTYKMWLVVVLFCLMGQTVAAITPEAARTDLAQENIPYTVEALVENVEKGNTEVVSRFL